MFWQGPKYAFVPSTFWKAAIWRCALLPGHYLFIEGSYPRRPGDKARIESFSHPPTKGKCLEFFYHMKGSGIGTLNVWLRRGQKIDSSPMWTLSGNQGDEWFRAMTTITENTQNWKVRKILIQQILFSRNVSGHFIKILCYWSSVVVALKWFLDDSEDLRYLTLFSLISSCCIVFIN